MAKTIKVTKKHDTYLFDSAAGKSCVTEKAVDVTEDCPKANKKNRAVFLFTRAKRGRIVQIDYFGGTIHFFVEELASKMRAAPRSDTFGLTASELGLTKDKLRTLIETHVPPKRISRIRK